MTHDEIIAVIQAHKEGKKLETKPKFMQNAEWGLSMSPGFNFNAYDYRVKAEPRKFWVNVYPYGMTIHASEESAKNYLNADGKTIKVCEVID